MGGIICLFGAGEGEGVIVRQYVAWDGDGGCVEEMAG